jgi:hypothetical protein
VAIRSTAYPGNLRTAVGQLIRDLVDGGGLRVVIEDSDWRTMMALARFLDDQARTPALLDWRKQTRPLSSLRSLCEILQLGTEPGSKGHHPFEDPHGKGP